MSLKFFLLSHTFCLLLLLVVQTLFGFNTGDLLKTVLLLLVGLSLFGFTRDLLKSVLLLLVGGLSLFGFDSSDLLKTILLLFIGLSISQVSLLLLILKSFGFDSRYLS